MNRTKKKKVEGGREEEEEEEKTSIWPRNRRNMERIIMENEITRYCYGLHDRIDPYDCRIVSGREG